MIIKNQINLMKTFINLNFKLFYFASIAIFSNEVINVDLKMKLERDFFHRLYLRRKSHLITLFILEIEIARLVPQMIVHRFHNMFKN